MEEGGLEKRIRNELENLRGMLQADGGDLEVVAISGKTVKLRLAGACGCCPHATMTIKNGIEERLKKNVDAGISVERVS